MFAVVVRTGVVVVVLERHVLCAFGGQVSEARVECTFLANDAAYLTLSRAVTQLRRSEIVTPGVGLTVCVVCGVSNGKVGFGRAFSLHSQSECITRVGRAACSAPCRNNGTGSTAFNLPCRSQPQLGRRIITIACPRF